MRWLRWLGGYVGLVAAAVSGCVNVTRLRGPDGAAAWSIECSVGRTSCFQRASKLCPDGYHVIDTSGGIAGTFIQQTKYGTTAVNVRRDTVVIACGREVTEAEQRREEASEAEVREDDAAIVAIQKHPKSPELGATKPEAQAVCRHQRGEWLDQNGKIGCRVRGANLFVCEMSDDHAVVRGCTRWMLGGDVADAREAVIEANGTPTSTDVGSTGFRVYTWETPTKTITLTGYPAGVIVSDRVTQADLTRQ